MFGRTMISAFTVAMLAAPALAQEREWVLDVAGEDVFLAFGVPNTNDLGVSFWCKIGHDEVSLFSPFPGSEAKPKLQIDIGANRFPLNEKLNDNDGSKTVEARLRPQKQILEKLESAERFNVILGKHKVTYPLDGADFRGLLRLCAGKVAPTDN
jgi:hypothetical protein